ncbi:YitT family protein [Histidinibacterium aquaticum]|uniref:YitT family protein n=1 Tax=Histidinibacterium aquaticum TaxID=2613962 RepID=A0A5J5GM78_9RHOB|nr:YitT family protein [Histidinibacterium aquaticum]KAA9009305.1 YitT family protein [Histidinibacterium aquaticum]
MTTETQDTAPAAQHTALEDAQGFFAGTMLCAFGLQMLTAMGLVTGQTAGLAVILSYVTGLSFGVLFFLVNLPFYVLALRRMGLTFTLKTFGCVAALSVFSEIMARLVVFERLDPWLGAVVFGLMTGTGLLILFRHGGSLGGVGILALYVQDRFGWRAGWVQLGFDLCLFAAAFAVIPPLMVVQSLVGAVVINLVIAVNHRRDRYVAT